MITKGFNDALCEIDKKRIVIRLLFIMSLIIRQIGFAFAFIKND